MQAPTSKGQGLRKNISLFCDSIVGASIARPPLPYQQPPKIFPAPLAGLQCRPLQAKGKIFIKIISLFCNFIVGGEHCSPGKPQFPSSDFLFSTKNRPAGAEEKLSLCPGRALFIFRRCRRCYGRLCRKSNSLRGSDVGFVLILFGFLFLFA